MPPVRDPEPLRRAEIVLLRHGATDYNARFLLNGDPDVDVSLSDDGRRAAQDAARLLEGIPWGVVYVTRFRRTHQTAAIVAPGFEPVVCALLDDIDVGEFEGRHRDDYRAWRGAHGVDVAPVGGESRLAVAHRYGRGLRQIAESTPRPTLVVTHDQPIRYVENALAGEDPVLGRIAPVENAVPYPYSAETLARGAALLEAYTGRTASPTARS